MNINNTLHSITSFVDCVSKEVESKKKLNKDNAKPIRTKLREQMLRQAKHLTKTFQDNFPHEYQYQRENLDCVQANALRLETSLVLLKNSLPSACERPEDKVLTEYRIEKALMHVKTLLSEIQYKIETNEQLIASGIHVLEDVDPVQLQMSQIFEQPYQQSFVLPAWGRGNSADEQNSQSYILPSWGMGN